MDVADKKGFTAADYAAQRTTLDEQIRVAEDDHHRAGYQQVLGEATQDDVDKALVMLDALKSKRRTLEAAWQEAQRRVAAANDALAKADQEKSIGEFKQLLAARVASAAKMEEAAKVLGAMVTEYHDAGARLKEIAGSLFKTYRQERSRDHLSLIHANLSDTRDVNLLAALLYREGCDLSHTHPATARFEYERMGGIVPLVEQINGKLRDRVLSLCPDLEDAA
ncbi:hypothetical protein LL251_07320 [Sphingobium naphthae]|nr:hypothetical protein [Sphingobium naphthae]